MNSSNTENIGLKIKKLRELKGYSQESLAHQLGITQKAYSKVEAGEIRLSLKRAKNIADILEIELTELLELEDKRLIGHITRNQCVNLGNKNVTNSHTLNDKIIEQYEKRITQLEQENAF